MIRSRRALLPAALALALLGAAAAPAASQSTTSAAAPAATPASLFPADEDLRVMLRYLVEDGATPGIVLGILEPDGSTRILHHGTAGPGARPLGPRTAFEIGSINKTFTGTILADMVARGEVSLSDPVSRYLPAGVTVPSRGREITLLDLATHRSGLPRMPDNFAPADPSDPYADYSAEQLYAFLSGHELRRDVGAEAEYSNLGMGLLGHALSRAAGKPFRQLVRERVLEPLGMEMTGYERTGELGEWMARGHGRDGEVVPHWGVSEAMSGAGGLHSNVEDMLRYLRASVGPPRTPLERAMRDAQRVQRPMGENAAIGLGWAVREADGRTIVSHGGGTAGFTTLIGFDPELRTGFVLLTNTGRFPDDLPMDFMRRGAPISIPEAAVSREVLARYAGAYEIAPGRSFVVALEDDGTLTLRVPNNVRFRMYAESDSSFYVKRAPWRIRFTRGADGEVAGLVVDMNGTERRGTRVAAEPRGVRDLPLSASQRAVYEGTYTLQGPGGRTLALRIFAEDGTLMAQAEGEEPHRLRFQGDHAFIPTFDDEVLLVFTVADGRAESVTLHQGGNQVPGPRAP